MTSHPASSALGTTCSGGGGAAAARAASATGRSVGATTPGKMAAGSPRGTG